MKKDLIDFLLSDLRPRPGIILTDYSLSYLNIYLTGVEITCGHIENSGNYLERFFGDKGFVKWSWQKYGLDQPSFKFHHYFDFAGGNEKEALEYIR